ncbi:hypothetical protein DN730_15525 [Marinomonas piezotolerans]|uniref:Tyr recombinase domain-containing protein n=1 Tax=Marinomonas piezotolerans TaxID=2213058 RepID=A0A370U5Q3_9GAMM|nr:site-specific integrase [Marinomonas piezotolerans]RDL43120.1 hypothetical protein DN730_15525 [Marinomonas piezotolerans]
MLSHKELIDRLMLIWGDSVHQQYQLFGIRHLLVNLVSLLNNETAFAGPNSSLLKYLQETVNSIQCTVTLEDCLMQLNRELSKSPCLALSLFDQTSDRYDSNCLSAKYLQLSMIFGLLSIEPEEFNGKPINERAKLKTEMFNACYEIGVVLRHRRDVVSNIPNCRFKTFIDSFLKFKHQADVGIGIPDSYLKKRVSKGLSYLLGIEFSQPPPAPRHYSPRKSPITPPAGDNALITIPLTVECEDDSESLLVEQQSLNPLDTEPLFAGRREINSRSSIESKEQSGVKLCPSRLSRSEKLALCDWLRTAANDVPKSLIILTIFTTWRPYEILGIHVSSSSTETDSFKNIDDAYGVLDLHNGFFWRKAPVVDGAYTSTTNDESWLHPHSIWLSLAIPDELLFALRNAFKDSESGRLFDLIDVKNTDQFNELTRIPRRQIRDGGGLRRKITLRALRYFLYGEVADDHGQHLASLMFANTEFIGPICHYYMARDVRSIVEIYNAVISKVGFRLREYETPQAENFIGSQLAIDSGLFAQRLKEKVGMLEDSLKGVKSCKDVEAVRRAYNSLCGYTLTMFFFCTSHRRLSSSFVELSMLTDNFSHVLVADKLHAGESASRLLPIPSLLRFQLESAITWIASISQNLNLKAPIKKKLLNSISLNGDEPFLGFWEDSGDLTPSSTAQIAYFLGDDWTLPQNSMRQFSFQMLLAHHKGVKYLLRQMGHSATETHPFNISSLMPFEGNEEKEHRTVFDELLVELGFKVLRKARKSSIIPVNEFPKKSKLKWPENTLLSKKVAGEKEKNAIKEHVQEACRNCLDGESRSVYDVLQERFAHDPKQFNYALKFLADHIENLDISNPLSKEQIQQLLDYKILSPQAIDTIYPFDTSLSIRRFNLVERALNMAAERALYCINEIYVEDIELILACSLILDDEAEIIRALGDPTQTITFKGIACAEGIITANVAKKTVIIGGRSSLFLALLLTRFSKTDVTLNFRDVERRIAHWLKVSKQKAYVHLSACLKEVTKLSVVLEAIADASKNIMVNLVKLVKNAPREGELGVQYALRSGKIESKQLSAIKLARMMYPNSYFPVTADEFDQLSMEAIAKTHLSIEAYDNFPLAEFGNDFIRFCNQSKINSFKTVESFWLKLLECNQSKNFHELVEMSSRLPELVVLILTWLYHWSKRKGRSSGSTGLRLSSIQTYFSRVGRPLINILGSKSLQALDSEELLDLYQQVIDSGNTDSKALRLSALQSFHQVCSSYFYMEDIDWRDLNVEQSSAEHSPNLVTPHEYTLAKELIANDPNMAEEDRMACLSILTLCYKMALRRGEVRRLRVSDFSFDDQLCLVRTSSLGTVKSISGNRRIPIDLLLSSEEFGLLKKVVSKASKHGKNTPLFFSQYRSDRIRSTDKLFNRVVEALRVTTGDPKIRLHDCRHSAINFIVTAIVIYNDQNDPIAMAVKLYLPNGNVDEFKQRIKRALLAPASPDSSLLPAIAQMVGHSKASTTIAHYLHLTHYWHWCLLERSAKTSSGFDKAIAHVTGISLLNLRVMKTRGACSAVQIAVSKLLNDKFPLLEKYNAMSRPIHRLSEWKNTNVARQIEDIVALEKGLRYLEFLSNRQKLLGSSELDLNLLPELDRFDLDELDVKDISLAYQKLMAEDFSIYRAYNILSLSNASTLPIDYRSKETRGYFKFESFIRLLESLLALKNSRPQDLEVLLDIWGADWDASTHSFRINISNAEAWAENLGILGIRIEYSDEISTRKHKTIQWLCREVKSATIKMGELSLPQLSHALFLLSLQRKREVLKA